MSPHRWTILADGTHVVDPQGWTIAKFYGDDADEHARIAVTAVNSHDALLAAAKDVVAYYSPSRDVPFGYDQGVLDVLITAIVAVEKLARYD